MTLNTETLLRTEWWTNHGCATHAMYGDDGEMQCAECLTDFRLEALGTLHAHVVKRRYVAINIEILCDQARDAIDGDEWEMAASMLRQAKEIARPDHPEIFYLEQLLPPEHRP